jgi:hypothetical protein
MKKLLILFSVGFFSALVVNAQNDPATQISIRISERMKDSLNLTSDQKTQIFNANIGLDQQKLTILQNYSNIDSIKYHLLIIENTRDGLYSPILTSEQYQLYVQKKKRLVNSY